MRPGGGGAARVRGRPAGRSARRGPVGDDHDGYVWCWSGLWSRGIRTRDERIRTERERDVMLIDSNDEVGPRRSPFAPGGSEARSACRAASSRISASTKPRTRGAGGDQNVAHTAWISKAPSVELGRTLLKRHVARPVESSRADSTADGLPIRPGLGDSGGTHASAYGSPRQADEGGVEWSWCARRRGRRAGSEAQRRGRTVLELSTAPGDMGKIIGGGPHGRALGRCCDVTAEEARRARAAGIRDDGDGTRDWDPGSGPKIATRTLELQ